MQQSPAKRSAQRKETVPDIARSKGVRSGEDPVIAVEEAQALSKMKAEVTITWRSAGVISPAFYANVASLRSLAPKALMFACHAASRTGETLDLRWMENDFEPRVWTCPAEHMKTGVEHRVPLMRESIAILEPLRTRGSDYVLMGQKRNQPLSNVSMTPLPTGCEGRTLPCPRGGRATGRVGEMPSVMSRLDMAMGISAVG